MATTANPEALDNPKREVGRIVADGCALQDITKPTDYGAFTSTLPDFRLREERSTETQEERGLFGRWLSLQPKDGALSALIKAARADRDIPKDGGPDDVRARLDSFGAEGDMFEAVDDAELDLPLL